MKKYSVTAIVLAFLMFFVCTGYYMAPSFNLSWPLHFDSTNNNVELYYDANVLTLTGHYLDVNDGGISTAHLADANVTTDKLADSNTTSAKIKDGDISQADMNDSSVGTPQIIDGSVSQADINDNAVTTGKLAANSVNTADVNTAAITPAKLSEAAYTGTFLYAIDVNGNDSYKVTLSPAPTAYAAGMIVIFDANTANTGACSLAVNGLVGKSLKVMHDRDPNDNYIEAGSIVMTVYDGTNFQIQTPAANNETGQ